MEWLRGQHRSSSGILRALSLAIVIPLVANSGTLAWAQSTSSGYVDASTVGTLQGQGLNCGSFCGGIVDPTTKQDINTSGTDGWTSADDAYCANHGVSTNSAVLPNPTLTPNPDIACDVPVLPGDTTCAAANQNVLRCKTHGTQVESHCLAWDADTGASSSEIKLITYDAAAAATCLTACMVKTPGLGGGLAIACSAAGIFATTQELMNVMSLQSGMQQAIYGFGSAAGLATSGLSLAQGIGEIKSKVAPKKKDSCITAVVMAALAGYRGYNIMKENNARTSECTNIQNLLSSAGVTLPSGSTTTTASTSSGSSTATAITPTTTSSSGTTASTSSGTIATVVVPTSSAITPTSQSAAATPLTVGSGSAGGSNASSPVASPVQLAQTAAGLDGSILSGTGLGQAVAPLAQSLASNPTAASQASNGDAGGLLSSGFGSQGSAGAALANVARAAQAAAAAGTFPGSAAAGTYTAGGGSAGSAGRGVAEEENPFAKLAAGAGGGAGDLNGGTPSTLGFDKPTDPCLDGADIWHTNCRGTLFDVISGRINRSRGRLEPAAAATTE